MGDSDDEQVNQNRLAASLKYFNSLEESVLLFLITGTIQIGQEHD